MSFLTVLPCTVAGTGPIFCVKVCHLSVTAAGVASAFFCSAEPSKKAIGLSPCSMTAMVSCGPFAGTPARASNETT